jgi:hypothetical protein
VKQHGYACIPTKLAGISVLGDSVSAFGVGDLVLVSVIRSFSVGGLDFSVQLRLFK